MEIEPQTELIATPLFDPPTVSDTEPETTTIITTTTTKREEA